MTRSTWVKLFLAAAALVAIVLVARALGLDVRQVSPDRIRAFVLSFGLWAPAIYLLIYGQPIIPLPASIMTAAGGLAFGPLLGPLAAIVGATLRAGNQFALARLLGREAMARLIRGPAARLDQRIAENGFKAVLLIRLIPNVPFDMQNYLLGFSKVRVMPYTLGTLLGVIPGSFAYTYLGYSLTDPRNTWKIAVAVGVIVGLILAQRAWQARQSKPPVVAKTRPPISAIG
jgi:uncharacterized membrane protein YdjX (TVP38/TMEM64 family)